jgi:hypothetical protein
MNLFYNPTLNELNSLIDKFVNEPTLSHLTVDNDGEVLLISENGDLTKQLDKFKFYIRGSPDAEMYSYRKFEGYKTVKNVV